MAAYDSRESTFDQRRGQIDSSHKLWLGLYAEGDFHRNEFIAGKAITAAIRYAYGAPQKKSREIENATKYTILSMAKWRYLFF
ncbi:hypothetical protein PKOR_16560 [Pontibacter korlensis]|uniref:Uncharacterized protein n=1 Tax=Pontibacter korlensis TaxID=400092 RepID=A0A0E3ZHD6_9BACT|nr:hypothetical protein PKOR_16560 [Pontibacter korlensis]